MPFDQFLRTFHQKLRPQRVQNRVTMHLEFEGPAPSRVKDALDYVFGWEKGKLDSYRPNQKQTRDFIDYLIFAIRAEAKARSPERCLALSNVLSYNETPGKVCFSGVDPSVFAFQLALRIREPSLLNQKSLGVCGAASLMTSFAKHNPAAFADYAISLMRQGKATFHGMTITPGSQIIAGQYSEKMAEADLVTMGSLATGFLGSVKEGKSAPGMCEWLRKAGYSNVNDKTLFEVFSEPSANARLANLREAEAAITRGKLVIMGIHTGGSQNPVQDLRNTKAYVIRRMDKGLRRESGDSIAKGRGFEIVGAFPPLPKTAKWSGHWILVTRLHVLPKEVTIKLYSWQESMQGTFPLEPFLTYYQGFLVADPPQPERPAS